MLWGRACVCVAWWGAAPSFAVPSLYYGWVWSIGASSCHHGLFQNLLRTRAHHTGCSCCQGGGLYLQGYSPAFAGVKYPQALTVRTTSFYQNTAEVAGAAIHFTRGALTLGPNVTFRSNSLLSGQNETIYNAANINWICQLGHFQQGTQNYGTRAETRDFDTCSNYPCPTTTYGATDDLTDSGCSGPCPKGHYCPGATIRPVPCKAARLQHTRAVSKCGQQMCCASVPHSYLSPTVAQALPATSTRRSSALPLRIASRARPDPTAISWRETAAVTSAHQES
jgi:hypothetical protein|eukprot:1071107-Prymnesium_polylepis.3